MDRHKCSGCSWLDSKEGMWCNRYVVSVDRVPGNCIVNNSSKDSSDGKKQRDR